MNRFERHKFFLQGKRAGAYDPAQPYLESAVRGAVARKLRALLRGGVPVVLYTPRWSEAGRFLQDLIPDLEVGAPTVAARTFSLHPLNGRGVAETRRWLMQGLSEFFALAPEGTIGFAVGSEGYRAQLRDLLERANHGPARVLLLHSMEQMNVEVRADLVEEFRDFVLRYGKSRRVNMVFAGALEPETFSLDIARALTLPDYGESEAASTFAELGVEHPEADRLALAKMVGGIPSVVEGLGRYTAGSGTLASTRDEVWRALGPLAEEMRAAVTLLTMDDRLADRLETVAKGPTEARPELDAALRRAGVLAPPARQTTLRAPVLGPLLRGR